MNENEGDTRCDEVLEWTGVLGDRVIAIEQTPRTTRFRVLAGDADEASLRALLREYFQLQLKSEVKPEPEVEVKLEA